MNANVRAVKIDNEDVMLAGIKNLTVSDFNEFIQMLHAINSHVAIQAVNSDFVAGIAHVLNILQQSLEAKKRGILLSKRIEIDILLRFACTNQIRKALDDIGLKNGVNNALVIAIGNMNDLETIYNYLQSNYILSDDVLTLSKRKLKLLVKVHNIPEEEIKASAGNHKLASVLAERANLLW
ncbi:MAG: KEOPS complex subunit Cgi121 [Nitrososphaerales archaeon]